MQVESQNVHVKYIVRKTQKEIKVYFSQKGKLQEDVEKRQNLMAFIQASEDSRNQNFRARICKCLRSPEIDFNRFLAAGATNRVILPARQATGWRNRFLGIDSWTPRTFINLGSRQSETSPAITDNFSRIIPQSTKGLLHPQNFAGFFLFFGVWRN